MKERKTKSISKLKKEVSEVLGQYVKLRDALRTTGDLNYCKCITCTILKPRKEFHAGHFIDRRHNVTLFDETNIHAQCPRCNVYLDGNILEYRRQIIRLYGEGYDVQLEDKAMEIKHFTRDELIELKEKYTQKVRELLKQEG
jgi:hypothetical protein